MNRQEREIGPDDADVTAQDLRRWFEFACWTTLVLAPILRWVYGPAVSADQLLARTALVILAACGALGLRLCAWLRRE
jgi:hypothetical protein